MAGDRIEPRFASDRMGQPVAGADERKERRATVGRDGGAEALVLGIDRLPELVLGGHARRAVIE